MSFDVVIRGGTVYDGTGAEGRVADVGVKDGRIAAIGSLEPSGEEVDATGLAVAPGFIDIHSHSDYTLLMDPRAVSAIHQGVTTEVVGNCGFGCFPIRDPQQARRAIYGYSDDLPISWSSAGEYFETLEACRPAVNVLSLVPNGQLRLATLGLADRPADAAELAEMQVLLRESLDHGAWGYSTGLEYAQEQGAPRGRADGAGAEGALLRDAHAQARRGRRRRGGRGDPHRRERRGAAAGLASRPAQRDRGEPPLHRARRDRARRGAGHRVRHAHAHLRADEPLRGAARLGARRRAGRARGDPARSGEARRDAPRTDRS